MHSRCIVPGRLACQVHCFQHPRMYWGLPGIHSLSQRLARMVALRAEGRRSERQGSKIGAHLRKVFLDKCGASCHWEPPTMHSRLDGYAQVLPANPWAHSTIEFLDLRNCFRNFSRDPRIALFWWSCPTAQVSRKGSISLRIYASLRNDQLPFKDPL